MKSCWKERYPKRMATTGIYRNEKTGEHIQIGGKQLGRHDNFTIEGFPLMTEQAGHGVIYEKWFKTEKEAKAGLRKYMKENC